MAKIKSMHKAVVISTDLSIKDIKKAEALCPDALQITKENGEVMFSVATGAKESISKYGIVFANDSKISVLVDAEKVDRNLLEEKFGNILLSLVAIEEIVEDALESFVANIDDLIEIEDEEGDE